MTILMILTGISACDYQQKRDMRHERKSRHYQTAMDEYRAGHLDAAVDGFEKLVREEPANSSARFQLACLLQDAKHDYLGAYCHYREYLAQQPESERAKLAKDRMGKCERELAKTLAEKFGIVTGEAYAEDMEKVRQELKDSENKRRELEKTLAQSTAKIAALEDDRKRLIKAVRSDTDTEKNLQAPSLKDARELLDEDDEPVDRIVLSKDVKSLKMESDEELKDAAGGPSVLPVQPKGAKEARDAARRAAQQRPANRPYEYTIEDGDTLYKIAERFYGRTSAWIEIRNANKAVISVDGRVKAGDRIVLP
jgi:predicted Zn-dependent protease